ncbi:MAG: histidine kinase [Oscillospiraceae bacterium]|nr:histidine kinase [Oscillospiraceae bacterium]
MRGKWSAFLERALRRVKLRYRFFFLFLFLSLLPQIIFSIISFSRSSRLAENDMHKYCVQINRGIRANFDLLFQQIDDLTVSVAYNREFQGMVSMYRGDQPMPATGSIRDYLQRSVILNKRAIIRTSVMITDADTLTESNGYVFDVQYQDVRNVSRIISPKVFEASMEADGLLVWDEVVSLSTPGYMFTSPGNGFQVTRTFSCIEQGVKNIGMLSMMYAPEYLKENYDGISGEGEVYLVGTEGDVLFCSDPELQFQKFPYLHDIAEYAPPDDEGIIYRKAGNGESLITYSISEKTGWGIAYVTPISPLINDSQQLLYEILLVSLTLTVASALAAKGFASSISKPIGRLVAMAEMLRKELFKTRDNPVGNDEITKLSEAFNDMAERIDGMIEETVAASNRERDLRLRLLQAQINPHFLHNTLDSIRWLARTNNDFEVAQRIEKLSGLFRLVLSSNDVFTTLEKEILYTQHYLYFQMQGYKDRLSIRWKVDESLLPCKVLKLILQPIVENCVIHAMKPSGERLHIDISIRRRDEEIVIVIADDGTGADEETTANVLMRPEKEDGHVAMRNVNDRIKEYFGADYGLSFRSEMGVGTVVVIRIPMRE